MADKTPIQTFLVEYTGLQNVYFQPPVSLKISYPAIIYSFEGYINRKADNGKYFIYEKYSLTYVHSDPTNALTKKLYTLDYCDFDRRFVSDRLYHDVYTLYY